MKINGWQIKLGEALEKGMGRRLNFEEKEIIYQEDDGDIEGIILFLEKKIDDYVKKEKQELLIKVFKILKSSYKTDKNKPYNMEYLEVNQRNKALLEVERKLKHQIII